MIYLVFSHGDYSLENILKSKTGIKAIDYEGAALRNPLYDLYNFFFTEIYFERVDFNLEQVLNRAISFLQARLLQKEPELAKNLVSLAPIYRKLFYIERICMILERELNNQLLDVIHRSIEVFNR
jgi:thiamine kinase-like enzyme